MQRFSAPIKLMNEETNTKQSKKRHVNWLSASHSNTQNLCGTTLFTYAETMFERVRCRTAYNASFVCLRLIFLSCFFLHLIIRTTTAISYIHIQNYSRATCICITSEQLHNDYWCFKLEHCSREREICLCLCVKTVNDVSSKISFVLYLYHEFLR